MEIYPFWEIGNGALISNFTAHFSKITIIKFSYDDSHIFTGSSDGSINSWLVTDIISNTCSSSEHTEKPTPHFYWIDHVDEVTDIFLTKDSFSSSKLLTASKDGTCNVRN